MTNPAFATDFDDFAKSMIRDIGHSSDQSLTTNAINHYLTENGIEDPISFFEREMKSTHSMRIHDEDLSITDRSYFRSGNVEAVTFFSSTYFNNIFSNYELNVIVYDLFSGERKIISRIRLNAP